MTNLLKHRGPDGEGHLFCENIAIGHRRLAIIDRRGGAQPMRDSTKRYAITYNGEIYNFKELRLELRKEGSVFRTASDTEVILEGFARHGTAFFQKLNGMFAFAILDEQTNTLTLARDRLGIKPLYIYESKKIILFASEIKAFYAHPDFTPESNPAAIKEYLTFSNLHQNISFFKNVRQVSPGSWIELRGEKCIEGVYWRSEYKLEHRSHTERINEFRNIMDRSVERHLISDVPVGCYLSGGIDSSSVAVTAHKLRTAAAKHNSLSQSNKSASARQTKKTVPLHVFTGEFQGGDKYSELAAAQSTAKSIEANQHIATITPNDFFESIHDITYALDEPRAGMGAFPQYLVSKLVKRHVTVVLTGHGGDELFAGYPLFKARLARSLHRNPVAALRAIVTTKPSELPHLLYYTLFPVIQREVGYGTFILFSNNEQKVLFTAAFAKASAMHDPYTYVRTLACDKLLSPESRVQEIYLRTYLPSLFIVEDKVGMAHSIEARTPICDNEMLAFSQSISLADKIHNGQLKSIPRDAMRDRLPAMLYTQPKKGFPTPLSLWFRGPLKQFLVSTLLDGKLAGRGVLEHRQVEKLIAAHCKVSTDGIRDYVQAAKLWSILQVELWHRIFIDGQDEIRARSRK